MSCHAVHYYLYHDGRSDDTEQMGGYMKEGEPLQSKISFGEVVKGIS